MIDWYLLIFIAFTLVILFLEKIGSHRTIYDYMNPGKEMGLSEGTYSLINQFISGATFLFPFILTEKGGLSSFFILSIVPFLLYFLLVKLTSSQERMNQLFPFQLDTSMKATPFYLLIFAFSSIGSILIHTSLIAIIFRDLFHLSPVLGVFLFLSFGFIIFGLGGNYGVNKIGTLISFAIFFVVSFTALTIYLRTGIGLVYEQFNYYFNGIFSGSFTENGLSFLTFLFIMLGHTITSFSFWSSINIVKSNHRLSALRFSIFSWTALSLAFAVLTIYIVVQTKALPLSQMMQMNGLLSHIIIYIVIAMLAIGTGHSLYSIVSLFLYAKSTQQTQLSSHQLLKQAYLVGIILSIMTGFAAVWLSPNIGAWLPYFVSFFSSAGVPFIFAYFKGSFHQKQYNLSVGLMGITGFWLSATIDNIWVIAPISALLSFVVQMIITRFKIFQT